jgi:hypothetical protein
MKSKINKIVAFMGLVVFLTLVSGDTSIAECRDGFAELRSNPHDEVGMTRRADWIDEEVFKDVFHIPTGVYLFLSAMAGLGVVALRGSTR